MLNLFIIYLLKNVVYGILEPIMQVKYLYHLEKENVCVCVCVCLCVCVCGHVYVVYEDTNLYNDMGMT